MRLSTQEISHFELLLLGDGKEALLHSPVVDKQNNQHNARLSVITENNLVEAA